mmetsp:Transcript_45848/g.93580  ORF Transcript_45848/g.93580 Transcript_45848/m.93580 type:complete len:296 (+) Transcript_45848:353-1240(+)
MPCASVKRHRTGRRSTPEEPRRRSQRTPPQPNRPVRSHRSRTEPTPTRNGARVGTSASHLHGLELAGEVGEVGGAQAGQRIPAAGGGETVLAAGGRALSAGGAVVLAGGDVVEGGAVQLVQGGVQEAQGALAGHDALGVDQGDHASDNGGGGGRAGAGVGGAADDDRVVVAHGGNIGVATAGRVEHGGRGQIGAVLQVVGHLGILPAGAREHTGESTASGDAAAGRAGARDLLLARLGALGGADRSHVRRGSGVGGVEAAARRVATGTLASHTIITSSHEDAHATQAELGSLGVE